MTPTLAEVTRELLKAYNRYPRKRLGQHFLVDPQVLQRIINAAELSRDDLVIEIGSGLGVVTSEIAKQAGKVIAIEIDKELVEISKNVLKACPNVEIIPGDILEISLDEIVKPFLEPENKILGSKNENFAEERKEPRLSVAGSFLKYGFKIIGNLPYYITAPIVEKIIEAENKPELAVLMVQKEVAERMAAAPGSKKYGSFSIFTQYHAEVKLTSFVSKSSFHPWPQVGSAIVVLKPYQTPKYAVKDKKHFFDIVHAAFQQRRKQLRNSLSEFNLEGCGIELNRRPEELSLEEFVTLANFSGII